MPFSFTAPTTWVPKSDSGVAELQRVLKTYVQITGYTPADPGTVDGIVGIKTVMAVVAMLPRVPGLPSEIRALAPVISLMLVTDDGRAQAFNLVKSNAGTISKAIIALEAYRIGTASGSPGATPTSTSIKAGTLQMHAAAAAVAAGMLPPVTATGGGAIPTSPELSIWFYDVWKRSYRVAVPRGTLAGFTNYVEVAPAVSQPNFGTQVSRGAFMSAIGQWWGSPLGMAAIAAALAGGGYAAYRGARSFL